MPPALVTVRPVFWQYFPLLVPPLTRLSNQHAIRSCVRSWSQATATAAADPKALSDPRDAVSSLRRQNGSQERQLDSATRLACSLWLRS